MKKIIIAILCISLLTAAIVVAININSENVQQNRRFPPQILMKLLSEAFISVILIKNPLIPIKPTASQI